MWEVALSSSWPSARTGHSYQGVSLPLYVVHHIRGTDHAMMSSGLRAVATGRECKTEDAGLWARLLLSPVWVEIFGFDECWDAWMLFPAALSLGAIPLWEKNFTSTCACTGKQMLVFTFHPVVMTFSPLPSVVHLLCLNTHTPPAHARAHSFTTHHLGAFCFRGEVS